MIVYTPPQEYPVPDGAMELPHSRVDNSSREYGDWTERQLLVLWKDRYTLREKLFQIPDVVRVVLKPWDPDSPDDRLPGGFLAELLRDDGNAPLALAIVCHETKVAERHSPEKLDELAELIRRT